MNKEQQEEYNKFLNEQMRIFEGHASRLGLRICNKIAELSKVEVI